MKLYTEEQVLEAIRIARTSKLNLDVGIIAHIITTYGILDKLTPIELPSDEEIEEKAEFLFPTVNIMGGPTYIAHKSFIEGVKWMRNKITNTKEK